MRNRHEAEEISHYEDDYVDTQISLYVYILEDLYSND
jgi:hypothetical protein